MKKIYFSILSCLLLIYSIPVYGESVTSSKPNDPVVTEEYLNTLFSSTPSDCTNDGDCHIIPYQTPKGCANGQVSCDGICKDTCTPAPLVCKSPKKKCSDGKCYKTCPCPTGTKRCDDGTCKKTCEIATVANCDIKTSIMGKNLRALFCKVGDRYNISASVLASLYARESKVWEGHTHVNRATFGGDIKSEDDFVSRCARNTATATGPVQIIDISWEGKPSWPVKNYEIPTSDKGNDKCSGGACSGAKKAFSLDHSMSRCRWIDAISSQGALLMIKFSYNAWQSKSACNISGIKNGKLVGPKWTDACVTAIAHAYYGGPGFEDRVLDPYHDIKK